MKKINHKIITKMMCPIWQIVFTFLLLIYVISSWWLVNNGGGVNTINGGFLYGYFEGIVFCIFLIIIWGSYEMRYKEVVIHEVKKQ